MKKGLISKLIKIFIVVIIPLAACFAVGSYAYTYYQDRFFDHYMEEASDENTEDRLVSYLEYINQSLEYSEENGEYDFYVKDKVTSEYGDLFTFSIIRGNEIKNEAYYNDRDNYLGKRDNYYLTYYFAVYNVNYEALATVLDPSGQHKLLYTELPTISIEIVDKENEDTLYKIVTTTTANVTAESDLTVIYDYGYSPEKDSEGNKLNASNPTSMRYYVLTGTTLKSNGFGSNVEIKVSVNSNFVDAENQLESEVVHTIEKDDFYNDSISKDTDENKEIKANIKKTFKKVYDRDIFEAGYTKFAFTKYIWWEGLLALVLVEIICASFVLVWNAEEEKEKKKSKK